MEVNYGGNFANSAVFIRELRRMMPRERRFRYNRRARRPEAPPVVPSPSLNDLYNSIEAAIALPSGRGHVSSYRAMEAAERGEEFNASVLKHTAVPSVKHHSVDVYDHRVYGARFVGEHGQRYVTSCQDQSIRVYETNMSDSPLAWVRTHNIPARGAYWTITDFDVSPDGRWLAYASISNFVHLVDLCNPHEPQVVLDFSISPKDIYSSAAAQPRFEGRVHIWSLKWGHDGTEIIVGTGAVHRRSYGLVLVYDVALRRVVEVIPAHDDDVNSVCFMQTGERNLLLSGSDDTLVKMWDRRDLRSRRQGENHRSCGVFVGHRHGLTCVSTKDDGRFLLSNGKDQFIKLWDARKCTSTDNLSSVNAPPRDFSFDYRMESCPRLGGYSGYYDDAVMTYAGSHETLQTLIRAYFSPMYSTGQKYIYCGSSDGCCVIYDVLTGKEVKRLRGHGEPVRDVSWHPYGCFLTTGSWDGRVLLWLPDNQSGVAVEET